MSDARSRVAPPARDSGFRRSPPRGACRICHEAGGDGRFDYIHCGLLALSFSSECCVNTSCATSSGCSSAHSIPIPPSASRTICPSNDCPLRRGLPFGAICTVTCSKGRQGSCVEIKAPLTLKSRRRPRADTVDPQVRRKTSTSVACLEPRRCSIYPSCPAHQPSRWRMPFLYDSVSHLPRTFFVG